MQAIDARTRSDRVTTFDEVILYASIATALAAASLVAGLAGGSIQIAAVGVALTVAGIVVSWRVRDWGPRGLLVGAPLGIAAAAAFNMLVERELAMDESSLILAQGEVGLMMALRMAILPIAFSYVLIKYDYMAFALVPALATFGLAGGQGNEILVGLCFGLFLPSALIAMGHGMLLSGMVHAGGRSDARWRLGGWRVRHWTALAITIVVIVGIAYALFFPIAYYVSEYRWQILTRVATGGIPAHQMGPMRGARDRSASILTVGRGPISPGHSPRLTIWGPLDPLWRGQVFDHFTGQAWLRTEAPEEDQAASADTVPPPIERPLTRRGLDISSSFHRQLGAKPETHLVRVDTTMPLIFFSPGQIERIELGGAGPRSRVRIDAYGCVESSGHYWSGGSYYQVVSSPLEIRGRPARSVLPTSMLPKTYLQVPFGSRRVADLARDVAGREPVTERKLMALVAHLQQNYVYTLEAPAAPIGKDAADYFLFTSKRGYCDLFATSLALMARAVGIPTRLVAGFAYGEGGESLTLRPRPDNPKGPAEPNYQMRESDAHTWVEAYIEPWGWISADATPASGESPIPVYRRSMLRLRFIFQDHPILRAIAGIVLLVASVSLALRLRGLRLPRPAFGRALPSPDARYSVVRVYAQLLLLLRRHGRARLPSQTPLEFLSSLCGPDCRAGVARSGTGRHGGPEGLAIPAPAAHGLVASVACRRSAVAGCRSRGASADSVGNATTGQRGAAETTPQPAHFRPLPKHRPWLRLRRPLGEKALVPALPAIAALTDLFLLARYSPAPVTDQTVAAAAQHLLAIRRTLSGKT